MDHVISTVNHLHNNKTTHKLRQRQHARPTVQYSTQACPTKSRLSISLQYFLKKKIGRRKDAASSSKVLCHTDVFALIKLTSQDMSICGTKKCCRQVDLTMQVLQSNANRLLAVALCLPCKHKNRLQSNFQ